MQGMSGRPPHRRAASIPEAGTAKLLHATQGITVWASARFGHVGMPQTGYGHNKAMRSLSISPVPSLFLSFQLAPRPNAGYPSLPCRARDIMQMQTKRQPGETQDIDGRGTV